MEHEARKLQQSKGYKDREWDRLSTYEKAQRPKENSTRMEKAIEKKKGCKKCGKGECKCK